jgi:hypothetical protein
MAATSDVEVREEERMAERLRERRTPAAAGRNGGS